MSELSGYIFNIQRASFDDGPGVRTVLFLKGCPISCFWCHNPESQKTMPELMVNIDRCKGCGACTEGCSSNAINNASVNRDLCAVCGKCTTLCIYNALEITGKCYTVSEVVRESLADKAFFDATGGGVTLSGGEPLMQAEFSLEILKALKHENTNTCIETSGICANDVIESFIPYVDYWLFDIKLTDEKYHKELLGVPYDMVLKNLYKLRDAGANITLRCPIMPGVNDNDEHFKAVAKLRDDVGAVAVDILPYHRLGRDKYKRLGLNEPKELTVPEPETVKKWEALFG